MIAARYSFLTLMIVTSIYAFGSDSDQTEVTTGDSAQKPAFAVGLHAFNRHGSLYFTSERPGAENKSLSMIIQSVNTAFAHGLSLAPETAIINDQKDQANPMHNGTIVLFDLMYDGKPVGVCKEAPNSIFMLDDLTTSSHQRIYAALDINDAEGKPSSGIKALAYGLTGKRTAASYGQNYYFSAVKPHEGAFGQLGSGIAVSKFIVIRDEKSLTLDILERRFENLDVTITDIAVDETQTVTTSGGKAFPIDCNTPQLKINDGTFTIENDHVVLHWAPETERLYVGLDVKADASCTSDQGAHALMVGRLYDDKMYLSPILPDDAICKETLLSAMGPNKRATVHMMQDMKTSSGLAYLIVVGGQGKPEDTSKQVNAIPLVHRGQLAQNEVEFGMDALQGLIASSTQVGVPQCNAVFGNPSAFIGIRVYEPARNNEELLTAQNSGVCVGGGADLPNAVSKIKIVNDAVFALVAQDGNGQKGGVFHSQPIFGVDGRIMQWTRWKRVVNSYEGVADMQMNPEIGNVITFQADKKTIIGTGWTQKKEVRQESNDIEYVLTHMFPSEVDGISSLIDVCAIESAAQKMSFMIATGFKKIALIETGADQENIFKAYTSGFSADVVHCADGTLKNLPLPDPNSKNPRIIEITGGVIDELGPIESAVVLTKCDESWLVVGGYYGAAILCDKNGHGWKASEGLLPHFNVLNSDFAFKKIIETKGLQKVMSDNGLLYTLSRTSLARCEISPELIVENKVAGQELASNSLGGFFDAGVSGPCALLATTKGLYTNGALTNIAKDDVVSWRAVEFPEPIAHPYHLFFVTPSGQENDFANRGQVYISTGSSGQNYSVVYRMYVDARDGVTDSSAQIVPHYGYDRSKVGFFKFHSYRNLFVTDGAYFFSTAPRQASCKAFVKLVDSANVLQSHVKPHLGHTIPLHLNKFKKATAIVQNSATGYWLVAGDFGLRMNRSK